MSIFSFECDYCGSKDHATTDCPHGMFSSSCDYCGSKNHATRDCPHGFLSSSCIYCESKNHASSDCPHGVFSSKSISEDDDYRNRITHEDREVTASTRNIASTYVDSGTSSGYSGSESSTSSGGITSDSSGGFVVAIIVLVGIVFAVFSTHHDQTVDTQSTSGTNVSNLSNAEQINVAFKERELNRKLRRIPQFMKTDTFTMVGTIARKTDMEGTGGYWYFDFKTGDGIVYPFMCSALSPVYFRMNQTDLQYIDGYDKLGTMYPTTLYISNSAHEYVTKRCRNKGCDGHVCPSVIVMGRP